MSRPARSSGKGCRPPPGAAVFPSGRCCPTTQAAALRISSVNAWRHSFPLSVDGGAAEGTPSLPVVTTITAVRQRTFSRTNCGAGRADWAGGPGESARSDRVAEDQGYKPEAKVTSKGELSWRGDCGRLAAQFPVARTSGILRGRGAGVAARVSDPATQISRETIDFVRIPPAGELSLLKAATRATASRRRGPTGPLPPQHALRPPA